MKKYSNDFASKSLTTKEINDIIDKQLSNKNVRTIVSNLANK
jgi:hypothetical protein